MDYEFRAEGTVELRGEGDNPRTLVGISPPWNTWSTPGAIAGGIIERFERGAFANLDDDILVTVEHDNARILGRTGMGTARVFETDNGLQYEVDLDDTTDGENTRKRVGNGNIQKSSFEFAVKPGGELLEYRDGGKFRTVLRGGAILRQVGPVARPAFGDSPAVSLRCAEEFKKLTETEHEIDHEAARLRAHKLREVELKVAESSLTV